MSDYISITNEVQHFSLDELQELRVHIESLISQREKARGVRLGSLPITLTKNAGKIFVASPYHPSFVKEARILNGKYASRQWSFDQRDEQRVRQGLYNVYGADDTAVPVVNVRMVINSANGDVQHLFDLGREIAYRNTRDEEVRLGAGVTILEGQFRRSCGSNKYPAIIQSGEVILLVRDVPATLAEFAEADDPNIYQIVEE